MLQSYWYSLSRTMFIKIEQNVGRVFITLLLHADHDEQGDYGL